VATGQATKAHHQRSDVTAVPASGVVAEAMVALVIAGEVLEKFGGDSVAETQRNMENFVAAMRPIPEPAAVEEIADDAMGDPL
jgi:chorismate synthase